MQIVEETLFNQMTRFFIFENTGNLSIHIDRIQIGGQTCSNDGFVVQNCYAFDLLPKQQYILQMHFKPGLHNAKMQTQRQTLYLIGEAHGQSFKFQLEAQIPFEQYKGILL